MASLATAQPLPDLLQLAEQNNPQLQALETDYRATLEQAPQVSQMPDPELGIGLFPLPVETRLGPQRLRLGATQMLPWKGTLDAKEAVVLAKAKTQYQQVAAVKLELFFQVKKAWLELYELEEKRDIARRSIRIFESMENFTLAKVESGKASLADVLRVQLKIQELEAELELLENQKLKPLAALNAVLNRPAATPVSVEDSLALAIIPFEREALLAEVRAQHPMVRMYALQQEISRKNMALNELAGKPTFGVGLDYIMVGKRSDADPPGNGRDILMPRASVRIPLHREQYEAKRREEELKIAAIDLRTEDLLNGFRTTIEQAYAEQQDAALKLKLYDELERTTQAAIEVLQSDYSASGRGFDELLRMQNDLVQYDRMRLRARVQSHLAKASVERFVF